MWHNNPLWADINGNSHRIDLVLKICFSHYNNAHIIFLFNDSIKPSLVVPNTHTWTLIFVKDHSGVLIDCELETQMVD